MKKRKIQKTGGSTLIVSLPKEWVKEDLKEGDEVHLEKDDGVIRIYLSDDESSTSQASISYEDNLGSLLRKVIAYYLVGYDFIRIESENVMSNKEEIKDRVRDRVMGLEVTGETSSEIVFQNMLKYSDLPTGQILRRMDSVNRSMFDDVVTSFDKVDKDVLKDVSVRENEIDRFYLLSLRQIKSAVRDHRVMEKLEIDSKLVCLGYRVIFKNLESIADLLTKISETMLSHDIDYPELMQKIAKDTFDCYQKSVDSLLDVDVELAEECIHQVEEVDTESDEFVDNVELNDLEEVKTIIDSFFEIRKLLSEIAEIAINISTGEIEPENI